MIRKRTRLLAQLAVLLVLSGLLSSCSFPTPAAPSSTPAAGSTPVAEQPAAVTSTAAPAPVEPTAAPAAGTCSVQAQSQAVRSAAEPDWSQLEPLPCYQLTLDLTKAETGAFVGTETLSFTNTTSSDLPDLVFRLYPNAPVLFGGSLNVTSVDIGGRLITLQPVLEDNTAFRLKLPQPLAPGESVTVNLGFEGQAPSNFGSGKTYGIFNLDTSLPLLVLANWYPVLAELQNGQWQAAAVIDIGDAVTSQTALFTVKIAAPSGWKIATTGVGAGTSSEPNQEITTFVSGPVRDFMIVASPQFEPETVTWQGIEMVHWRLPDTMVNAGALSVTQDSIEIYTDRFGPYPYAQIDVVDVPLRMASGVEYPGLVLIEEGLYTSSQGQQFLPVVIAHEVAHQWWYAVVGNDVRANPWQDEALATFSSFLYFEKYDPGYLQGMLQSFQNQVQSYEQGHTQNAIDQPVTAFENNDSGYSTLVYYKGALFFSNLRQQIGDQAFFNALHSYYENSMYRIVPPEALLNAFERSCDCDLSNFYQQWGVIP